MSSFMSPATMPFVMLINLGFVLFGYRLRGYVRGELTMMKLCIIVFASASFTTSCFFLDSRAGVLGLSVSHFLAGIIFGAYSDKVDSN